MRLHRCAGSPEPLLSLCANITKMWLFKYTENFTTKKWNFSDKNSRYSPYFCSKHTLGSSFEPPRLCFWAEIRKIIYTPVNQNFYYIKVGFKGSNYIGVFLWWMVLFPWCCLYMYEYFSQWLSSVLLILMSVFVRKWTWTAEPHQTLTVWRRVTIYKQVSFYRSSS